MNRRRASIASTSVRPSANKRHAIRYASELRSHPIVPQNTPPSALYEEKKRGHAARCPCGKLKNGLRPLSNSLTLSNFSTVPARSTNRGRRKSGRSDPMGRYRKAAQRIAKLVVASHREKSGEELARAGIAKKLADNLQEFVEDVNAALRARNLDAQMRIRVCPAERQGPCTILRVSIAKGRDAEDVLVTISPDHDCVMVAGRPILKGDNPTDAICREVIRWLT
jgi:hypothetical protein